MTENDLYPIKLRPVLKDAVWGGCRLSSEYGFENISGKLAEAWTLSVCDGGVSVAENGTYAGSTLNRCGCSTPFPLLVKFIGADLPLSVQVHPSKNELWYIVECDDNTHIAYGLNGEYSDKELLSGARSGHLQKMLNIIPVKPGDVFYIPTGMVHALGGGITVAEIQQNSDITYRLYDYGRLYKGMPRELHAEQAVKVLKNYTPQEAELMRTAGSTIYENQYCMSSGVSLRVIADCEYFRVILMSGSGNASLPEINSDFISLLCVKGSGSIGNENISSGDSFYLPNRFPDKDIVLNTAEMLIIYPA